MSMNADCSASQIAAQPAVDNFESKHDFSKQALKRVEPAGPAIKQAALHEQRVKGYGERRGPGYQPQPIDPAQLGAVAAEQMYGLLLRITLL
jgi:hypothetical protein